jgi:nitrite reductase (NADH) small subunit/3-phenylpropionate/trans-cinnamate dioxygenase ferredoxin subunit
MESQRVARSEELPEGGSHVVQYQGKAVALFRSAGILYAIDDRCPHAGAPLSEGWKGASSLAPGTTGGSP